MKNVSPSFSTQPTFLSDYAREPEQRKDRNSPGQTRPIEGSPACHFSEKPFFFYFPTMTSSKPEK